jgi:hypothetical protein
MLQNTVIFRHLTHRFTVSLPDTIIILCTFAKTHRMAKNGKLCILRPVIACMTIPYRSAKLSVFESCTVF